MKKFRHDLEEAKRQGVEGVSQLRRGETEGEVIFSWTYEGLSTPFTLSMLAVNYDGYPDDTPWLIFLQDNDDIPEAVRKTLDALPLAIQGKKIGAAMEKICDRLRTTMKRCISGQHDNDEDGNEAGDGEGDEDMIESDDSEQEYDSDEDGFGNIDIDTRPVSSSSLSNTGQVVTAAAPDVVEAMAREYSMAKEAGIRVGKVTKTAHHFSIFSLSVRATSLGLQSARLAAWDIDVSDYVVLLIRYSGYFISLDDVCSCNASNLPSFRLGKCRTYKPSLSSASNAFGIEVSSNGEDGSKGEFRPIYMSASLNHFMNNEFFHMIPLRKKGLSWAEANEMIQDRMPSTAAVTSSGVATRYVGPAEWLLKQDYMAGTSGRRTSLPLVAVQFAMLHVVNCVDFCMVCHRKLESSFEAIKPFVCERKLCLFQYMSLGFGPSLEHSILTEGRVVDLLLGFCSTSLGSGGDFEQPLGLSMKVPRCSDALRMVDGGSSVDPTDNAIVPSMSVQFNLDQARFNITQVKDAEGRTCAEATADYHKARLAPGQWIVLVGGPEGDYNCRITSRNGSMFDFEVVGQIKAPLIPKAPRPGSPVKKKVHVEADARYLPGTVHPYWYDFDDLRDAIRREILTFLLKSLPSVVEMQSYLSSKPGNRLKDWGRISPPALILLRWIVASNRSYIQYIPPGHRDLIPGVDETWQQFRFAQGSAEKEHQFSQALHESGLVNSKVPTLFAWHGSSLRNWHSIIREGLHFNKVMNGRAYGNGVYFAKDFRTSSGYSGHSTAVGWQGSLISMSMGIALCEIVNLPDQFVSKHPYYVVNQVHWIQCRYLLIPPVMATDLKPPQPSQPFLLPSNLVPKFTGIKYLPQTETHTVCGPDGKVLDIPMPEWMRHGQKNNQVTEDSAFGMGTALSPLLIMDDDDDQDSDSDLEFLRSSTMSSSYILDPTKTTFRPGTLDLDNLPKLSQPSWSTPTGQRQIQHQIKSMVKTMQTTPLHETGWYVDFENMDNMYQWIIELHTFDPALCLAKDMEKLGISSVVLEMRFGRDYPISPPFVRVVQPTFLTLQEGGGGHVQAGGAICIELLTASGWSPAAAVENVIIQIRSAISSTEMPARLAPRQIGHLYTPQSAMEGYRRSIAFHKWKMPSDTVETATQQPTVANHQQGNFMSG